MRGKRLLAVMLYALIATTCFAQFGRPCDPTGTWLGGSDPTVPGYQMTVSPDSFDRYLLVFQVANNPGIYGTAYTGELKRTGPRTFVEHAAALFEINQGAADFYASLGVILTDLSKPELDAIYGHGVMPDCDTIQFTIDWYGLYLPYTLDKTPYVTQPELEVVQDFLGGSPIKETYHRVLTTDGCPVCKLGSNHGPVSGMMKSPGSDWRKH